MHNNSHLQALIVNERIQSYMQEAEMSRLVPDKTPSIHWGPALLDKSRNFMAKILTVRFVRSRLRLPSSETGR